MGYITSLDELPTEINLYCYQNKDLFQRLRQFAIQAEPKHPGNGRTPREKKRHIFLGKANEFAMHYLFFKGFYSEPDLTIHDGDDGGYDAVHNEFDITADYKVRSFTKDYLEFPSKILRSDFYIISYDCHIYIERSQIWVAEPVIYSRKSIVEKLEPSYDVTKQLDWFVRKQNLKALRLKPILTRPEDFI